MMSPSILVIFVLSLSWLVYFVAGEYGESVVKFYETQQPSPGFYSAYIVASSSSGGVLYAVNSIPDGEINSYMSSLYVSVTYGSTWNVNVPTCSNMLGLAVNSSGSFVAIACSYGAYISDDYAENWRSATPPSIYDTSWESVSVSNSGQYIILGQAQGQVFTSTDFGYNWIAVPAYVPQGGADSMNTVQSVKVCGTGQVMAITFEYGYVWISSDYGVTWMNATSLSQGCYGDVFMSISGDNLIAVGCYGLEQVWRSQDYGESWQVGPAYGYWASIASSASGQYMAAVNAITDSAVAGSAVYVSSDYGVFWSRIAATEIPISEDNSFVYLSVTVSHSGQFICAGSTTWIACSNDYGSSSSWIFPLQSLSQPVNSLAMSGSGSIVYAALPNVGIYKSSNYGSIFSLVNNNTEYAWKSVATSASGEVVLIAATIPFTEATTKLVKDQVWLSTTGGEGAWTVTPVHTGEVVSVAVDYSGQMLAVAASIPGVNATIQLSVNGGISWESLLPPAATMNWVTIALDSTGQVTYLITDELLMYNTSNRGQTWIKQDVTLAVKHNGDGETYVNTAGFAMNANATIIAAGGQLEEGNIFLYTASNGWTATVIGDSYQSVAAATTNPQQLVASTNTGVYVSSDYGAWWYPASIPAGSYGPVASDAAGVNLLAMSNQTASVLYTTNYDSVRPFGEDDDVVVSSATFYKTEYPRYNRYGSIFASSADGSVIVCVQAGVAVRVSLNYGSDWINRTMVIDAPCCSPNAIAVNSTAEMIVVAYGGVFVSWNNGITWTQTLETVYTLWDVGCSSSGQYVVAVQTGFISVSSNYGAENSWMTTVNLNPETQYLFAAVSMSSSGEVMLVGFATVIDGSALWMSSNYGTTWAPITNSKVVSQEAFCAVAVSGDGTYMSAWQFGNDFSISSAQLYSSNDGGSTWSVNTFQAQELDYYYSPYSIATANPAVQVLATLSTLYVSDDYGQTWGKAMFSVPEDTNNAEWLSVVANANGDRLLAYDSYNLELFSTNPSSQTHVPSPTPTTSPGNNAVSAGVIAGAVVGSIVGAVALIGGIGYFVTSSSAAAAAGTAATAGATTSSVTAVGGAPASSGSVQNPMAAAGHDAL